MTTINLAIIGSGFMGTLYARILHQMLGARVVAVCDMDLARAQTLAAEVNATAYDNCIRMLTERSEIDGVLICTPEHDHVAPTLAVLAAGKPFMLEKPLATSVADAQTILAAYRQTPVMSMIAYSLRFDPRYAAMQAAVDRGEVGEVIHMSARRNMPEAVLKRLNGRVEAPFWVGVHDIDMMRWLTGSNVTRVMSVATDKGMTGYPVKTVYYALLTFENGVVAALENAWSVVPLVGRPQAYMFRVEGTKGQLQVRSFEQGITVYGEATVTEPDTYYMPTSFGRITGVYHDQLAYFVQCLRDGKPTAIPITEGWNGVLAAAAIVQSAAEHREVVL